jgi:hypothetical protein
LPNDHHLPLFLTVDTPYWKRCIYEERKPLHS